MKVLIVDDHIAIRSHLQKILAKNGHDAVTAANGALAVEKAKENLPDIILMDIKMPVMDGFDAIKALKTSDKTANIPVIVITGEGETEAESQALSLGADAYIKKPVVVGDVLRLLETYS